MVTAGLRALCCKQRPKVRKGTPGAECQGMAMKFIPSTHVVLRALAWTFSRVAVPQQL